MPPRKKQADDDQPTLKHSTFAVDKKIADEIRAIAKEAKTTTQEVVNQFLRYGIDHGTIEVQVRTVTVSPKKRGTK